MPVSSVIIGVDLYPIAPIRNVITFQSDITTKECSDTIENNLANWKVDVVLHDGAPNMGKNWLHDAYNQNVLVVNALKIACAHLNKGGWFVTKIFRSADYNSLLWVFGKLFGKVHATKPQASRQESAEIFVVCQNYKKPSDIDPRFFDPSALFADISSFDETLKKQKADLLKPANKIKKAKAQGYEDGDALKTVTDIAFVTSNNHMDHLAQCHTINLTNSDIIQHASTDDEIKECCRDLKVLGRKDLLKLLKWRRDLRKDLTAKLMKAIKEGDTNGEDDEDNLDQVSLKSDDDDDIEAAPELQLDDIEAQLDEEKRKETRRLKKKEEKRNRDYQQRVSYGMVNQGDVLIEEEHDLFSLNRITDKRHLDSIDDAEPEELVDEPQDPDDLEKQKQSQRKSVTFSRKADVQYFELDDDYDEGGDETFEPFNDEERPEKPLEDKIKASTKILKDSNAKSALDRLGVKNSTGGGLLTDLMDVNQSKRAAASRFFDSDEFKDLDLEKDLESDMVDNMARSQHPLITPSSGKRKADDMDLSRFDDGLDMDLNPDPPSDSDSADSDSEDELHQKRKKQVKLDPEGLALATMMVTSEKNRKEIVDEGWNRYAHADSHLAPKWFREEEAKHYRRNVPVSQELVKEYKQKLRDIDAKPIKKVMQAKARQKRRAMRKMEKVKKKVDAITSNEDLTQRERVNQIKTVYKNATKTKKKEVKVVVARKGLPTKRPGKGKYKVVDSRMKKDLRAKQRRETKGKKGGKRPSSGGRSKKKKQSNNSLNAGSKRPQKIRSKKGSKSRRK